MTTIFGALGVTPSLRGQPTNIWTLQAGNARLIPAGTWLISTGGYISIQEYDAIAQIWRPIGNHATGPDYINSDGVNYRLANQTGCVVGAYLTNAGTGYTSAPTVTVPSSSGAVLKAIVGGLVNTSVTVVNAGTSYVYPPIVAFDAPPAGGIQATGYCTLSSGTVSTVTVTNQGAGYTNNPNVYLINDSRDTTGSGATATATLTGSQTIGAIVVTDFGSPVSAVPAITISGGAGSSGAATALMAYVISSYTVTSAGSGYVGNVLVTGFAAPISASGTNPAIQTSLVKQRQCWIAASINSTALTATGQTVYDGGIFPVVPTGYVMGWSNGSAAQVSFTGSGTTDTAVILPV